jgi:hypothetical protein
VFRQIPSHHIDIDTISTLGVDPSLVVIDELGNGWRFVAPSNSQEDLRGDDAGVSNSITVQA